MRVPEGFGVERVKDVDAAALREVSDAFGAKLPEAFERELLEEGRLLVRELARPKHPWFEVLHPRQSLALLRATEEAWTEDQFGDEDEDREAARSFLARTRRLYPFQYRTTYVHDFWCFFLDNVTAEGSLIVNVDHDEYDLDFLGTEPVTSNGWPFAPYSYEAFRAWHEGHVEVTLSGR